MLYDFIKIVFGDFFLLLLSKRRIIFSFDDEMEPRRGAQAREVVGSCHPVRNNKIIEYNENYLM